jgi:integrase
MHADNWPETCICGEKHQFVFTTRNGLPIEPRNINRAFDVQCARYGVRRITIHDTRRTCGSLPAALDVRPRVAVAILRRSKIALTMEITQVPDEVTRAALRQLSDQLDLPAATRLSDLDDLAADLTDTEPDDDD